MKSDVTVAISYTMRTDMENNNCIKKVKHSFFWWQWEETEEDHDWIYYTEKLRGCKNCFQWERYFGLRETGTGYASEDWRKTKLTIEEEKKMI